MLVTQQCDTGRHIWSSSKLGAFHQNPASPRMSSREQLKTQQDWREHYSQFLPSHESTLLPCFDQVTGFEGIESSSSERQFAGRSQLEHRHNVATLDNRRDVTEIITINRPGSAPGNFEEKASNGLGQDSISPAKSTAQLLTLAPLSSTSPSVKGRTDTSAGLRRDLNTVVDAKEVEDEDDDEDDQMLDPEDGSGPPQTEAERRAERRKMKRFRLTHQQTRFLMSEFAKQAHPDAAHRERLSREIPGLSPRQVQVWFQNRRAKIKRLTADDRDRMLIMRAVPDGFDNVQALHSPYGAVQGIGTPLQSPIDYASYGEQVVMRPLLVDTIRRQEIEEQHLSPTGLSPSFGHAGFAPPGSISTSDVLSPLNSGDRFYGSHQSSPLSAGPRTANSFNLQTSSDAYKIHQHPRHPRLLQPLQLRDTMSRTRSQSLQSPLRTSMSWKGETLDYAGYQTGAASPTNTRRHQPQYQPDQAGINPGSSHHFDTNPYPDSTYSSQPTPLQSPATTAPRIRSASTAFPSGLDLHNEYRTPNNQQMGPPGAPPTPHATTFSNPFAVNSSGFASAPLSAPSDFQLPRTPIDVGQRDYHMSQLSAPMAPPQDFRSAYNQVLSPVRPTQTEGTFNTQQPQQHSTGASVQAQSAETPVFLPIDMDRTRLGHRRKRTFSMPLQFDGL